MGQLVLSVAGAVIGSFIPGVGTAIGWAAGPAVGGALMIDHKTTNQDTHEPFEHIDCPDTRPRGC